jgi:hypothetical protein
MRHEERKLDRSQLGFSLAANSTYSRFGCRCLLLCACRPAKKPIPLFSSLHAGIDQLPHAAEVSALPVSAAAIRAAQELVVQ